MTYALCYHPNGDIMKYIELFLFTNVFILFESTIYIMFFYFKDYYNQKRKELYEELFLTINTFIFIFLYNVFKEKLFIFYITINLLLILQSNNIKMSIFLSSLQLSFIYYETNIIPILLYSIYYIVYIFVHKKNKIYYINIFIILTVIYMINYIKTYLSFNTNNIVIILLFILSAYIITLYIIYLKKRVKLYLNIKQIEKDKAFKTSIFKVTHEIKNPLAVIKGYLQIFDSKDIEKTEKYKSILIREVDNALLVLKDFNELNNIKIQKEYMNFNSLLLDIKETVVPFFSTKRINLNIDSDENICIYADYNRLKQVFINILKNSCEALNENGNINIKATIINNKLSISIKDNGKGMTKDTLDNLFTPFYTLKENGTGLGLCLSKEIIENHNGTIKYTSVINKYTKVKIIIPCN